MGSMPESDSFFIFAGEPSGDLHGCHLLKQLKNRFPTASFWGVGGPEMRKEKLECMFHMEDFSVMGFSDVLRSLPKLWKQFHRIKKSILVRCPKSVILIDYPGFNLRLAKHLRKGGYTGKIVQYISPTVWAHGKKRIQQMERSLDLLITIYPFEPDYFKNTSLSVHYAGNPLQEYLADYSYENDWRSEINLPTTEHLIALFPGSRQAEIQRNLPFILKTASLIKKKNPEIIFAISYVDEEIKSLIKNILFVSFSSLAMGKDVYLVPKKYNYELMGHCRSALAKSGTVTLELALHRCPSVIVYRLSFFNRFVARFFLRLKLPYYCITNILSRKETYPEYIKKSSSPKIIAEALESIHIEGDRRRECILDCERIRQALGSEKTSLKAAQAIESLFV